MEQIVLNLFISVKITPYKPRAKAPAILTRSVLRSSNAQETETRKDYFYARPVGRSGGVVRQNALPGHIHARGGGAENQPAGVSSPGESETLR